MRGEQRKGEGEKRNKSNIISKSKRVHAQQKDEEEHPERGTSDNDMVHDKIIPRHFDACIPCIHCVLCVQRMELCLLCVVRGARVAMIGSLFSGTHTVSHRSVSLKHTYTQHSMYLWVYVCDVCACVYMAWCVCVHRSVVCCCMFCASCSGSPTRVT